MQIRGTKDINIFSRNDRDIPTEEEIEKFWTVDHNAPRYKPEFQSHAQVYQLRPGVGVHIPVSFPHWVQNGDDISISLNVNFSIPGSDSRESLPDELPAEEGRADADTARKIRPERQRQKRSDSSGGLVKEHLTRPKALGVKKSNSDNRTAIKPPDRAKRLRRMPA